MSNLLEQFIEEARDLLGTASNDLLVLEKDPEDSESINELFRSIHTLKGSSALFEIPPFTKLVHAGEDILDEVRSGSLAISSKLIDVQLQLLDAVEKWLDELEADGALPEDAERRSIELREALAGCRGSATGDEVTTVTPPTVVAHDQAHAWLGEIDEDLRLAMYHQTVAENSELITLEYRPDAQCFFQGDDPMQTCRNIPALQYLDITAEHAGEAPEDFDPYNCTLVIRAISLALVEDVNDAFRYVREQVNVRVLGAEALVGSISNQPAENDSDHLKRRLVEDQLRLLEMPGTPQAMLGNMAAAARTLANLARALNDADTAQKFLATTSESEDTWNPLSLSTLAHTWLDQSIANRRGAHVAKTSRAEDIPKEPVHHNRILKVEQSKVDRLMALIGELIVAKNSLSFLAKRAETVYESREMSREIFERYGVIDRLAQEMQEAIMEVRLLPVSEIFQRFPRLVRDIGQKLEKNIKLELSGEETRIDKNVIELLADPLIHILRNSVDHGIESPQTRLANGKSEFGTIQMSAQQVGDLVVIEVSDDGAGIDHQKVLAKALDHHIINAEEADLMESDEISKLIFHPGLSTADAISDLSGRGVGMDVVLTSVQGVGGDVTVHSERGIETVRLSLPLSMAVMRVMTIETDNTPYAIPIDIISETVRITTDRIRLFKDVETFLLRDTVVPLVRLRNLLALPDVHREEEAVLVLRTGEGLLGLVVDRFDEHMDIILKPLEGVLASMRSYAGTALLGDGRVLLVLDMKELLAS